MRVVVVGAGIGGLALARGLCADGLPVRVLERAPGPRPGGGAVTLASNGLAALAGLGVPLPEGAGGALARLAFHEHRGRSLGEVDLGPIRASTGFGFTTMPREALLAHLGAGLQIEYDREVTDVAAGAVLTRRGPVEADVVVGADGQCSAVRRAVVDPAPATDIGRVRWEGLGPVLPRIGQGTRGEFLMGPEGFAGVVPAGDGLVQWWFDVRRAPGDPPPIDPVDRLRRRFACYGGPVPELLEALRTGDATLVPHARHEMLPGRGPVTLLGDAAHAFPPSHSQGADQALEDAWLLRRILVDLARHAPPRGAPRVGAVLRRYERERFARVRPLARFATAEVTHRDPPPFARVAGLAPMLAGRAYGRLIRSWSSVLNQPRGQSSS